MVTVLEEAVLGVHILAGFLALFAGLGALGTTKGGRRHRFAGRVFVYAMAVVSGTAIGLYPLDPGFGRFFLALVAVFSFYFAFSGYRVLSRKRPADGPEVLDWGAVAVFAVASAGILLLGGFLFVDGNGFAPVLLVFGAIGTTFAASDVRTFRARPDPGSWVGEHVIRMGAAYIATVSAFSAVNFLFLPMVARWLWPTVLGVPLFVVLRRRYERRFAPG